MTNHLFDTCTQMIHAAVVMNISTEGKIIMSQTELLHIALGSIVPNPIKLRSVDTEGVGFLELVESIKERGVINAISVRKVTDETGENYQLVDGLHRFTGAQHAGLDSIPCQVIESDDSQVLFDQVITNSQGVDTKPVEFSYQVKTIMMQNVFMTVGELAQKLGKSTSWINERLKLNNIESDELKSLIDKGDITLSNAYAIAMLPVEEQTNYTEQAITMGAEEFVPLVTERVKEVKEAARQARVAAPVAFIPVAKLKKLGELKTAAADEALAISASEGLTAEQAFAEGIKFALNMDTSGLASQEEAYDAKQKAKADAAEARKAKREAAKQKKAEEAGNAVADEAEASA